ncbi:MAG: DUF2520 domain-containing protein [Chitinophagaceae bacterium]
MNVVIIGTGNVATVLGRLFKKTGATIKQVFGRNRDNTAALASELNSLPCSEWSSIDKEADLYLVAIADTALYDLGQQLVLSNQLVVHTAGSVTKDVLKNISKNYGVLYPLQSLRKEMPLLTEIPLLIDGNNEQTRQTIWEIALRLSSNISFMGDEGRLKLHVAAIYMNNFTNHLYAVTEDFCKKEDVSFNLLLPLAMETVKRINLVSPSQVVTGPAARKDEITIKKHLHLLRAYPSIQKLYQQLTNSIREFN